LENIEKMQAFIFWLRDMLRSYIMVVARLNSKRVLKKGGILKNTTDFFSISMTSSFCALRLLRSSKLVLWILRLKDNYCKKGIIF